MDGVDLRAWPRVGVQRGITTATQAGVVVYVAAFLAAVPRGGYDVVGGLAVTPAVIALGMLMSLWFARHEADPWIRRLVVFAFVAKMLAVVAYRSVVIGMYGGVADVVRYHNAGSGIAAALWRGELPVDGLQETIGSRGLDLLTGVVYAALGPSSHTGSVFFATLSFAGSYLFYRAFAASIPGGRRRLYAMLVFLLPSLLFWSATIGKEAWIMAMLGVAAYASTRLLTGQRGLFLLLPAVVGIGLIRPHMAALLLAALAAAPLTRRQPGAGTLVRRGRLVLAGAILGLGLASAFLAVRTFGIASPSPSAVAGFLEAVAENTATGDSRFENVGTLNPLLAPVAAVSVLFRPFPFEATNPVLLAASLEALLVGGLLVVRWRAVSHALRSVRANPYVAFVVLYTLLFVLAYSYFNNLGLLVRERTQVLPFVLLLPCLPSRRRPDTDRAGTK